MFKQICIVCTNDLLSKIKNRQITSILDFIFSLSDESGDSELLLVLYLITLLFQERVMDLQQLVETLQYVLDVAYTMEVNRNDV